MSVSIRIQEPSPSRNIISRLQIVHAGFNIVVVSAISERIIGVYNAVFKGRIAGFNSSRAVAPGIIGIGADQRAAFVVDSDDIALRLI